MTRNDQAAKRITVTRVIVRLNQCANCPATLPPVPYIDRYGRKLCCVHCLTNPRGCRCKYGERAVPETEWG